MFMTFSEDTDEVDDSSSHWHPVGKIGCCDAEDYELKEGGAVCRNLLKLPKGYHQLHANQVFLIIAGLSRPNHASANFFPTLKLQ
jgi:hypothetical protein